MVAIMTPPIGGGSSGSAIAQNFHGNGVATPNETITLVSFTAGQTLFRGFMAMGTANAEVWIEIDGSPLYGTSSRISVVKDAYRVIPNPESYPSAISVVTLKVKNTDDATGTFEGVIFNE